MTGLTTEEIEAIESLINMPDETYKLMETACPHVAKAAKMCREQFS